MKKIKRFLWRFAILLYGLLIYGGDIIEYIISCDEGERYADGRGYNLDRSKTIFFRYWYRY